MADSAALPSSTKAATMKPAPFKPGAIPFVGKGVDFMSLAPQTEPEPEIEQGVDLAGQTKIIFAAGRGKTGKTYVLRWIAEISFQEAKCQFWRTSIQATPASRGISTA